MTIVYYKGYAIEAKEGQYRLILYPNQWYPSYQLITQAIDTIIKATSNEFKS